MVTLKKITSECFEDLYGAFLHRDDPLSDKQRWRDIFDYRFPNHQNYCGYALYDDSEVVGMIGMIFCERTVGGSVEKFCNLHTWWVREDHRAHSLVLLRPLLRLRDHTLTYFTPCNIGRSITAKFGFEELSTQLRLLLPLSSRHLKKNVLRPNIIDDPIELSQKLPKLCSTIFLDHQPYDCRHLLLETDAGVCYLLYNHVIRYRLHYCHIHFVSDLDVFQKSEPFIRRHLMERHRVKAVALDTRLSRALLLPRSFNFWSPANGMYQSDRLSAEQIDNLYSDVTFLSLTTLPHLRFELQSRLAVWGDRLPFKRSKTKKTG